MRETRPFVARLISRTWNFNAELFVANLHDMRGDDGIYDLIYHDITMN